MLAAAGVGLGLTGGYYLIQDKEEQTPISESFKAAEARQQLEKEIKFQWIVTGVVIAAYLLYI